MAALADSGHEGGLALAQLLLSLRFNPHLMNGRLISAAKPNRWTKKSNPSFEDSYRTYGVGDSVSYED